MIRRRAIALVLGLRSIAALLVGVAPPADASSPWIWLMPTGRVCVQTGTQTWLPLASAAYHWDHATDASMVGKSSCTGYARNMTVIVKGYSSLDNQCAKTGSPTYTWRQVRGAWAWTPDAPTISVNYASAYHAACQGTYRKRLSLVTHELGHVLGLPHSSGVTVMLPRLQTTYVDPQYQDVYKLDRWY